MTEFTKLKADVRNYMGSFSAKESRTIIKVYSRAYTDLRYIIFNGSVLLGMEETTFYLVGDLKKDDKFATAAVIRTGGLGYPNYYINRDLVGNLETLTRFEDSRLLEFAKALGIE
ncbi:hypothetical protein CL616_02710 [archaeon]|nr:hypothetical protein [archaeon]|tara:strand:- start:779 stop:1123 length:345 start_codon:yes stop_codon:yes gene_type:complete